MGDVRSLSVQLRADVSDFVRAMDRSAQATTRVSAAAQASAAAQSKAAAIAEAAAEAEAAAQAAAAVAADKAAAAQVAAATAAADASAANVLAAQEAAAAATAAAADEVAARQAAAAAAQASTVAQLQLNEANAAAATAVRLNTAAVTAQAEAQAATAAAAQAAAAAVVAGAAAQADASAENIASSQAAAAAAASASMEEATASARAATAAQAAAAAQVQANELMATASAGAATTAAAAGASGAALATATTKVGGLMVGIGAAAALGVGIAVKSFADFDEQMSKVQAATHAGTDEMTQLRDAAMDAGAKTKYSATEAGQGIEEMAKAGISTTDIINGGLMGALNMAASGSMAVADAAGIASSTMVQFGLSGKDLPHVADLLSAGANKALGSVTDLGMALKYVGPVAAGMGVSVEQTTGALAGLASQGMLGEQAGTGLRGVLSSLTSPSHQASEEIQRLGVHLYDAQGKFLGLSNMAGELTKAYAPMTDAQRDASLGILFGNAQVTTARDLYKMGAAGIDQWTKSVNDSGYATKTAAIQMDNLEGDLSNLGSSIQNDFIKGGSSANAVLRDMAKSAKFLADNVGSLDGPVNSMALALGVTTAAVGLAGGAALLAAPKFAAMQASMATLSTSAPRLASGLGMVGKAAGGIGLAFVGLTAAEAAGKHFAGVTISSSAETSKALLGMGTSMSAVNKLIAASGDKTDHNWQFTSLADAAHKLNDNNLLGDMTGKLGDLLHLGGKYGVEQEIKAIGVSLGGLVSDGHADQAKVQFEELSAEWVKGGNKVSELRKLMPGYTDALADASNKQTLAAASGDQVASALTGVTGSADDAKKAVDGLDDALDAILKHTFNVEDATSEYEAAIDALTASVKENGTTLDLSTDKGRANQKAIEDRVSTGVKLIEAMAQEGDGQEILAAKAGELKNSFIDQATAMGIPKEAVERYAKVFDQIPAQVTTQVQAAGADQAAAQVQNLLALLQKIPGAAKTSIAQAKGYLASGDSYGESSVAAHIAQNKAASPKQVFSPNAPLFAKGSLSKAVAQEHGGVIDYFADGSENHVAQIAPAGSMRVWAEPETGGEAYIPLATSKRDRSKSILENVAGRFGGQVSWYAHGDVIGGQGPTMSAVSAAAITSGLVAVPGPVTTGRYSAALSAEVISAKAAADAEAHLNDVRDAGTATMETYRQSLSDVADAVSAQRDTAVQGLQDQVDALKTANTAALDAARNAKVSAPAIRALQEQQTAAEKAAQDKVAAAKKANTQASKDLKAADDALIKNRQKQIDADNTAAQTALTAAKDQDTAATRELTDATSELNDAQARALQLAQSVASSASKGGALSSLWGDGSVKALDDAAAALAKASEAADAANTAMAGESADAALSRRTQALSDLASAGTAYAAAQTAFGMSDQQVQGSLGQVTAKVTDLGAAYGVAGSKVADLTSGMTVQARSGADLLASMQRELARTQELSADVQQLMGAGLDSGLLDQVIGGGTGSGLDMARAILGGGSGLVGQLNDTQSQLIGAANGLGTVVSSARYAPGYSAPTVAPYSASGAITATLDAQSVALMTQTIQAVQAVANRPVVASLSGAVSKINAANAATSYRSN